ncbi:sensor histidine kinase [Cerasicoccus maritimus]|uniref:sensor histidine kinase n=1 Tax=Cerasicoccus maritimus TaxID=490089 RepID=UPI00285252F3|nr:sensor histidine kinase [Cerasicoccus maritimus]
MNPGISIWNRLLGFMVVMLVCVGGLLIWQHKEGQKSGENLLRTAASQRQLTLKRVNRIISRSLENFALTQGRQTLEQLIKQPDLATSARDADIDYLAVIRPDASIALSQDLRRGEANAALAPNQQTLAYLIEQGENALFFAPSPRSPLQCAFTPLQPGNSGQPSGYLLVGRNWDRLFMTNLSMSAEAHIQTIPLNSVNALPSGFLDGNREYRITEIGVGPMGQPVLAYTATFNLNRELDIIQQNQTRHRQISLAVLGVMMLFFAVLWKWLAYPIRLVSEALETDDPTVLKPILNEDYDWARIAQRLTESSEARLELAREVQRQQEEARIREETAHVRESLARDLHDGVIQSVYAVGLQLERANLMTSRNPDKAKERINDCKNSLNGVISELRGFIKGLTPEPLQGKSLQDALEQLVIHTQKSTEAKLHIHISPEACEALDTAQSLQLYQISRELLSNAIRHARAQNIQIRLAYDGESVQLLVIDDGIGIDETQRRPDSRGMTNLQDRARQMGSIVKVSINTPTGTRIRVTVPLNNT